MAPHACISSHSAPICQSNVCLTVHLMGKIVNLRPFPMGKPNCPFSLTEKMDKVNLVD
ncbi:hypothetical protein HanIR_Chr02g0060821 [Helianthus annuus]|nr:hypothetical protein HanIR_Chr02g0060821 [Helianthus annuus]